MKKFFSFINIENEISVAEIARVLQAERRGVVMECLSIIKQQYSDDTDSFRLDPSVQKIANLYGINLHLIR